MTFFQDLRQAARSLRRDRGVTAVIVAMLTVGIAANAIMFGVVDQLLLRAPSGVGHADAVRRAYFGSERPRRPGGLVGSDRNSYPVAAAVRDRVPAFASAAATSLQDVTIGAGPGARPAHIQLVDAAYFPLLEVQPAIGRFFTSVDATTTDAAPVVVLGHRFWRSEYAADLQIIGRELRIEGRLLTVVGVGPAGFSGIEDNPVDAWVPIGTLAPTLLGERWASNPGRFAFGLVARLASDATPTLADAHATAAYRALLAESPDLPFDQRGTVFTAPLARLRSPNGVLPQGQVGLWLVGVSAIVLLIAIANVASLLLARTLARRREIAIRVALGIGRTRLLRQFLIESAVLATLSAAVAIGVAYVGGRLIQQLLLPGFAWDAGVVDTRVLLVTLAVGVLTAFCAGLAPAFQAISTDLTGSLRTAQAVTGGRTGLLRTGLLLVQVALSVVLLVGAGLFMRSFIAVRGHDVGIDLDRVIHTILPDRPGMSLAAVEAQYADARERIGGLPGVERVAIARGSTPMGISGASTVLKEGWTLSDTTGRPMPMTSVVGADYFATLGASLERGRWLTLEEDRDGSRVTVINRALAADFWPGADPIGQCLQFTTNGPCTYVVGIVENILTYSRADTETAQLYLAPSHPQASGKRPRGLLIRTDGIAGPLVPTVRRVLQSLTPDMPYVEVATLDEKTAPELQPWRLGTTMFVLFGAAALVMAAVGLYSAMAHAVSQRSREIGIRVALGASAWRVVTQISRHGAATIAAGTTLGLLVAGLSTRWLSDLLFHTSPRDPLVFATVAVVLMVAGLAAAVVPARRSTAVDPLIVLKTE